MLKKVFAELDEWIESENAERAQDGRIKVGVCEIKVIGQTALLEAQISLHVPATMDVDVFANYEYPVKKKFEDCLREMERSLIRLGTRLGCLKKPNMWSFLLGNG